MSTTVKILFIILMSLYLLGLFTISLKFILEKYYPKLKNDKEKPENQVLFKDEDSKEILKEEKVELKEEKQNEKFDFKEFISKVRKSPTYKSFKVAVISILIGILLGFLIMVITKPSSSLEGLRRLFVGGMRSKRSIGDVLADAVPIMLTGLAFAFASKTGLFNIGASGQFIVGAVFALYAARLLTLPPVIHWMVCVLAGVLAGAIWGAIPGFLKAFFNVSEVIGTIMMNYIGIYLVSIMAIYPPVFDTLYNRIAINHPTAWTPILGLNKIFGGSKIDIGIFVAILVAILIFFILKKTTLGYQLKAVGYSSTASKAAGINYKKNIIISMAIAGGLAGLGGVFAYLAKSPLFLSGMSHVPPQGFEGMSVALLANSHPVGIIFTSVFISYLKNSAETLQIVGYNREIASVIIALIIFMAALSKIISIVLDKGILKNLFKKKVKEEAQVEVNDHV
ncbi:MAG: ABC transporter permease [Bacilli bacterium]|jgi:ABC-type uncharacterized transport system permease subunit